MHENTDPMHRIADALQTFAAAAHRIADAMAGPAAPVAAPPVVAGAPLAETVETSDSLADPVEPGAPLADPAAPRKRGRPTKAAAAAAAVPPAVAVPAAAAVEAAAAAAADDGPDMTEGEVIEARAKLRTALSTCLGTHGEDIARVRLAHQRMSDVAPRDIAAAVARLTAP